MPRIVLTVSLSHPMQPERGVEIGQVLDSHQEGGDRYFLADLQAWCYGNKTMLMLWEMDLFAPYSEEDPTPDFLLATLWQSFEQGLLHRFSDEPGLGPVP